MNIDNILATAERFSSLPNEQYDQREYSHDCGTPSCIAGHAVAVALEKDQSFVRQFIEKRKIKDIPDEITYEYIDDKKSWWIRIIATEWLGLAAPMAEILFTEDPSIYEGPDMPTAKQAANVLTALADEGFVDWSKAYGTVDTCSG